MDDYKRALHTIMECQKNRPLVVGCCDSRLGPTGPTGPTGATGPATITVGTTTTGAPETQASVTNSGTTSDVVLDFVIPAGATGSIGPTGSTGPPGPSSTIDSILVDNDGTQTVAANSLIDLGTLINSTGTALTFTAPNTITMTEAGTYLILFESLASNTSTLGSLGASLMVNGVIVPNASEYVPGTTTQTQFVLQHNYTASAGDTITVSNESTVSNNYHDTSLSLIKLA